MQLLTSATFGSEAGNVPHPLHRAAGTSRKEGDLGEQCNFSKLLFTVLLSSCAVWGHSPAPVCCGSFPDHTRVQRKRDRPWCRSGVCTWLASSSSPMLPVTSCWSWDLGREVVTTGSLRGLCLQPCEGTGEIRSVCVVLACLRRSSLPWLESLAVPLLYSQ